MPIDRLPERLRTPAESVKRAMLTDGTVLVILGLACFTRGLSYIGYAPSTSHPAEELLQIGIWAGVWLIIGLWCMVSAMWHRTRWAALALGGGVGLHLLWALSFLRATYTGDFPRGWVSSIGYLTIVALVLWSVWRGSRAEVRFREG